MLADFIMIIVLKSNERFTFTSFGDFIVLKGNIFSVIVSYRCNVSVRKSENQNSLRHFMFRAKLVPLEDVFAFNSSHFARTKRAVFIASRLTVNDNCSDPVVSNTCSSGVSNPTNLYLSGFFSLLTHRLMPSPIHIFGFQGECELIVRDKSSSLIT